MGGSSYRSVQTQPQPVTSAVPDFGADGLKDLTNYQKKKLLSGEVVLVSSHEGAPEGKTIISAALIFEVPLERAWSILSDTEGQAEYLKEIEELKIIEQGPEYNRMFFVVRVMEQKVSYTVVHHFRPDKFYFWWELDPSADNDLKELYGFWKLQRLDEHRTVARYGSLVRPSFPVPAFIRNWLSRSNVRSSLVKVKRYVESKPGE
ncbi:MAG: SRPBCC family protein [Candidatus Saccharicenans sp.]